MRTWLSVLLFSWVFFYHCHGQIDSILSLRGQQQIKAFWDIYALTSADDSVRSLHMLDSLEVLCIRRKAQELRKQVWLLRTTYRAQHLYLRSQTGVRILQDGIAEARQHGWDEIVAECMIVLGTLHYFQQDYGPAFEHMIKGYELLQELGFDRYPHTLRHVASIGYTYHHFADYEAAIPYLRQTLSMPSPWNEGGFQRHTLNTIGLCFRELTQYDSAIHYFSLSKKDALIANDTFWASLANGNKGHVYFLQGKYDEAIPLIEQDYRESINAIQYGSAVNAAMNLATIYAARGNGTLAAPYLLFARKHVARDDLHAMSRYYDNMYQISKQQHNLQTAIAYADSFQDFNSRFEQQRDAGIIEQAKHKIQVEKHAHEIETLESHRNRQVLIRDGILSMVLLVGIILILWINRQRLLRQKAYELEVLRKQAAEKELSEARLQLLAFTEKLKEKSELISAFEVEIALLHQGGIDHSDERHIHLTKLLNATILTDNDWREFRYNFDKIYPHFFTALRLKAPDLTQADQRMLALTKLELAPREMVAMLGVSYDAVKKSRKRLMKRLGLPEDAQLSEYVNQF